MNQTIIPYISIRNTGDAIHFYKRAFGATEVMRHTDDKGQIRHAEIRIGNSILMMHEEVPEFPELRSIQAFGGSPVNIFAYIDDVDSLYAQAVSAGAKALGPVEDKPYGRSAGVVDPFGLTWWLCTAPA